MKRKRILSEIRVLFSLKNCCELFLPVSVSVKNNGLPQINASNLPNTNFQFNEAIRFFIRNQFL